MARTDEGDFELVLGNKQLLSVFFIVVVLLGVFFTMGYIVGRNSSPEAMTEMAAAAGEPLVVQAGSSSGSAETGQPASGGEAESRPAASKTEAEPAAPPLPPVTAKAEPSPPPRTTPPPRRAAARAEPAPGQTFLQVAATSRTEGEVLLDVLRKKDFNGRLAPVPDQDLFRVLVGPIEGTSALAEARTGLQAIGFKPFTRKY